MPLTAGTKLGPYEIRSALGAGGMGEVYAALDTRLDRTVALKVLPTHLAFSPESKQRFDREARAISALNHPNICQLYDIGSQGGVDFLIMEFLEGETLADRLRKGALPLNETLKIAIALADALAVAHRQGIVHRDLKPGNIMLTKGGAKLMDFGLAKPLGAPAAGAVSSSAPSFTAAPTVSGPSPLTPLTAAGSVVGTIQYMSPEQIEGKEADARSDIFALGAVLYEMITGNRPFQGKSQISLASAILEKDPEPITSTSAAVPPAFDHVVTACLQKNPEDRFQTANDVKLELQWIASGKSSVAQSLQSAAPAPQRSLRNERLGWAIALVAALVLGAAAMFLLYPAKPAPVIRAFINPPENTAMNLVGDSAGPPVLSPDGSMIAFTTTNQDGTVLLWVRRMDSGEARSLPGTDGAYFPFWSPDSRSLGFFSGAKLRLIELSGGLPQVLCDAALGRGGAWAPGGVIVYTPDATGPMLRVNITAPSPAPLSTLDAAQHTSHRWPFLLPDGKHILYLAMHHEPSKAANDAIYYASLDGRENRPVTRAQSNAIYAAGYILFARNDQLLAQHFDPVKGTVSGEPRVVAKGVMNDYTTWHMDASASDNGMLVYASGGEGDLQLVWLDRTGNETGVIAEKLSNLRFAVLSPQGDRAALQIDAGASDTWVLDLARGVRTRLTFGPVLNITPVWSPDGKWLAYVTMTHGHYSIVRKRSDGSGAEESLATVENQAWLSQWSRDGKYILFYYGTDDQAGSWVVPLEGDHKPRQVLDRGAAPTLSPDGHWLSYTSTESGGPEVYVVGFEGAQGKWQVSAHGGFDSRWSANGKELFYLNSTFNLLSVPVTSSGGALQFGSTQTLVRRWSAPSVFYDVSADGKRILTGKALQQVNQSVTVLTNFTAELNKK